MKKLFTFRIGLVVLAGLLFQHGCKPTELTTDEAVSAAGGQLVTAADGTIDGQYIVVLTKDAFSSLPLESYGRQQSRLKGVANQFLTQFGINPDKLIHIYGSALPGVAVRLTPAELAKLRKSPLVAYIEADRVSNAVMGEVLADPAKSAKVAAGAGIQEVPWGITSVGGFVNYTGQNVAYVIDCGIDITHPDLKVDTTRGYSVFRFGIHKSVKDYDGHGTLVSGIIAALNNTIGVVGVAAGATVVPVKVCAAPTKVITSDLIAGVNYVAANGRPGDVANISLGIEASTAADQAVVTMASRGIFVAVSAGNTNVGQNITDANQVSPARANGPTIFTASGHDKQGGFATVSCVGNPPIDFSAPAIGVRSTYKGAGYLVITQGTTCATAHLAGILLANGGIIYPNGAVTNDPDGTPDIRASRIPR